MKQIMKTAATYEQYRNRAALAGGALGAAMGGGAGYLRAKHKGYDKRTAKKHALIGGVGGGALGAGAGVYAAPHLKYRGHNGKDETQERADRAFGSAKVHFSKSNQFSAAGEHDKADRAFNDGSRAFYNSLEIREMADTSLRNPREGKPDRKSKIQTLKAYDRYRP